ncbi:phosphorothioated DNA-binding restriction endonuclease [Marinicrinis sediminis]|uniref:Phosphorothioated DNA-binding restriction endonuclease n=1 Tax=Marinicrinis sediminis TaxID=1652465 RepID=A0ABW5R7D2_9BACL
MDKHEWLRRLSHLSIWKKHGQRAPHKPLFILYALGRFQRGENIVVSYEEAKGPLTQLLKEFGPPRRSYHPEEPFVRLATDGIWELSATVDRSSFTDKQLRNQGIKGQFTPEVEELLQQDPALISQSAIYILEDHFPESIHEDILQAVGLALHVHTYRKKARDPKFRERVLRAYAYSCAVCGFHVRLGHQLVGVEAAHIRWHQSGGPDREENGLALCSLHHKLFDRGVFTVTDQHRLWVSEEAHGTRGFEEWLLRYHGKAIMEPVRSEYAPGDLYLEWHVREVFRGNARRYEA